jgi:Glycosyltransferase family 87
LRFVPRPPHCQNVARRRPNIRLDQSTPWWATCGTHVTTRVTSPDRRSRAREVFRTRSRAAAESSTSWFPLFGLSLAVLTAASLGFVPTLAGAAACALLAVTVAALVLPMIHFTTVPRSSWVGVLCAVVAFPTYQLLSRFLLDNPSLALLSSGTATAVTWVVVWGPFRRERVAAVITVVLLASVTGTVAVALSHAARQGDVYMFVSEGSKALLSGENPYSHTYPNVYTPEESARYYGVGVVLGDHLAYGFPYLPASLLMAMPGFLVGDVRLAGFFAIAVIAAALAIMRRGVAGRAVAVTLLCGPTTVLVALSSWTELGQIALIAAALLAFSRRRLFIAAVILGWVFATKQYAVVTIPALLLLRDHFRWRHWSVLLGSFLLVTLPFWLTAPEDFRRSVVDFHLAQPFRSESSSVLVLLVKTIGWPPPWTYGVLPLVCGVAAATVLAWRLHPGAKAFAFTTAVSLSFTILMSKQAFPNYWGLVGGCLLIAAALEGPDLSYRAPRSALGEPRSNAPSALLSRHGER